MFHVYGIKICIDVHADTFYMIVAKFTSKKKKVKRAKVMFSTNLSLKIVSLQIKLFYSVRNTSNGLLASIVSSDIKMFSIYFISLTVSLYPITA